MTMQASDRRINSFCRPEASRRRGSRPAQAGRRQAPAPLPGGSCGCVVQSRGSSCATRSRSHGTALNIPPARTNANSSPVKPSRGADRRRGDHELLRGALENRGCDLVALVTRLLHVGRERRDRRRLEVLAVDGLKQLFRTLYAEMRQHARREARRLPAPVGLPHDRAQRQTAHPVAAAFVAKHVAPPAGPRGVAVAIAAVGNRTGPGDDDHAGAVADPGAQRDQRIVDHQKARLVSDAAHDAENDRRVLRTVDAGDAEADGRRDDALIRHGFFHHRVQNLLELELADRLEIGPRAPGRRHDTGLRRRPEGRWSSCRRRRSPGRARTRF